MTARKLRLQERARTMAHQPDTTPMEHHMDSRPPSLKEQLQQYIRQQVSEMAQQNDMGTFEDEDDFEDEGDEQDFFSPYEMSEMQEDAPLDQPETQTLDGTDESPPPETPPPEQAVSPPEPSGSADSL